MGNPLPPRNRYFTTIGSSSVKRLLLIITSTADEISSGTNIGDVERPWTIKIWVLSEFFLAILRLRCTLKTEFALKYTGDRPRQPASEIKLMLSRVSWALAQISCFLLLWTWIVFTLQHRAHVHIKLTKHCVVCVFCLLLLLLSIVFFASERPKWYNCPFENKKRGIVG